MQMPVLVCQEEPSAGRPYASVLCPQSASRLRPPCACIAQIVTSLGKACGSIADWLMCIDTLFMNVPDLSGNTDR